MNLFSRNKDTKEKYVKISQGELEKLRFSKMEAETLATQMKHMKNFIDRLNRWCYEDVGLNYNRMICGIKCLRLKNRDEKYAGFILETVKTDIPELHYSYTIYGYFEDNENYASPNYVAHFRHVLSERPIGITNHIELTNTYVRDDCCRMGLGSYGMDMLKKIAADFHCEYISGRRSAKEKTPEEENKLWNFYEKNGFEQSDEDDYIKYTVINHPAKDHLIMDETKTDAKDLE